MISAGAFYKMIIAEECKSAKQGGARAFGISVFNRLLRVLKRSYKSFLIPRMKTNNRLPYK